MGRTLALGAVLLVALAATGGLLVYLLGDRVEGERGDLAEASRDDVRLDAASLTGRAEARDVAPAPLERLLADLRREEGERYEAAATEIRERARVDAALLERLVEGLEGPRCSAYVQALAALGAPGALPLARFAIVSSGWRRGSVLDVLERMGPQAAPAVDVLRIHLPEERDVRDRRQMLQVLAAVGPAARVATPLLVGYLTPPLDDTVVGDAANTLVAVDADKPDTLGVLRGALLDEDTRARPGVLRALVRLGPAAGALVPIVIDLLEDPEETTRYAAAAFLGDGSQADRAVIAGLVSMLEHDHQQGQRVAARALVALGPLGVRALSDVATKVEAIDVRLSAARVLMDAPEHSAVCARVLLSVLAEDCDKGWKNAALAWLAQLDPPPDPKLVLPGILRALEDPTLAKNACRALANVPGEEARAALRTTLGREDEPDVGVSALDALLLSLADDPGQAALLASLLRLETPASLAGVAIERATRLSPKAPSSVLLPALEPWLAHEDATLRSLAHELLGHLQGDDEERVRRLLEGLDDPRIVVACASALRLLPAFAHRTFPALVEALLALPADSPCEFSVSWAAIVLARSWPGARAWVTKRKASTDEAGGKRLQNLLRRIR